MKHLAFKRPTASAAALAVITLAVAYGGCDKPQPAPKVADPDVGQTAAAKGPALEPPRIPSEPGKFGPALSHIRQGEHYDVDLHTEVKICSGCHADIAQEWSESLHAFASLANPFFRVSFDDFVKDAGADKARFCAGCHDPALTFDGAVTQDVSPKDRRAHIGVSCGHCHGLVEVTRDGNASYTLSTAPIPYPKPGDDESLRKHKERVASPALRTNELCMSCHRGFLGPATGHEVVIRGVNEVTHYSNSPYGGSSASRIDPGVEEKNCRDCHMPKGGDNQKASHRFVGGHATIASLIGSDEQLALVQQMLQGAVRMHVGQLGVGDIRVAPAPEKVHKDEVVWADVVIWNKGAGHRFPGGALDLRDTWIEVEFTDATGKRLGAAGIEHDKTGSDESAMVLHAVVASNEGEIVKRHRVDSFRAPVNDYSILPRDALVARYTWKATDDVTPPIRATARLRHRRVHEPLREQACDDFKTKRGQEFAKWSKEYKGVIIDPCKPQPVIEVATAWAELGGGRSDDVPTWRRHYERGLGLLHNVQENLPEAIDAFEHARATLPDDAPDEDRARVHFGQGLAAGAQGRIQDAMDQWAMAEKLVGEHAAIHYARGVVHQRTFHNEEATMWFEKASKLEDDDRIWRSLAISAGSVGKARVAYDAARAGLRLEPRDPHLLRSQMLALRKLDGVSDDWVAAAKAAFSTYKRDEMAPTIRDKCSANDPMCRDMRQPMQVTELR